MISSDQHYENDTISGQSILSISNSDTNVAKYLILLYTWCIWVAIYLVMWPLVQGHCTATRRTQP